MDALVCKHIFGRERRHGCFIDDCCGDGCVTDVADCFIALKLSEKGKQYPSDCPQWQEIMPSCYSTDMAAAWEVVEYVRLNAKLDEYTVDYIRLEWYGGKWCCRIHFTPHDDDIVWAMDESLPLAICKACLLAMGVSEV